MENSIVFAPNTVTNN